MNFEIVVVKYKGSKDYELPKVNGDLSIDELIDQIKKNNKISISYDEDYSDYIDNPEKISYCSASIKNGKYINEECEDIKYFDINKAMDEVSSIEEKDLIYRFLIRLITQR